MIAATEISPGEESSSDEMNSFATAIGAEPGRFGATTTAGSGAPALQQFVRAVLFDSDAGAQQLCAVRCVRCKQFPSGASIVPMSTMVIADRRKALRNMASGYHKYCALR